TRICCGTHADFTRRTRGGIPGRCKPISGTRTSNTQSDIPNWHRPGSRVGGRIRTSSLTEARGHRRRCIMDDPTSLIENHEFIIDCARYADGLLSEQDVKKKYRFDDATWERLGKDDALVEAIEAEKLRRIRNGSTKRERAQQLVA